MNESGNTIKIHNDQEDFKYSDKAFYRTSQNMNHTPNSEGKIHVVDFVNQNIFNNEKTNLYS